MEETFTERNGLCWIRTKTSSRNSKFSSVSRTPWNNCSITCASTVTIICWIFTTTQVGGAVVNSIITKKKNSNQKPDSSYVNEPWSAELDYWGDSETDFFYINGTISSR
jgi:hypothetical protein